MSIADNMAVVAGNLAQAFVAISSKSHGKGYLLLV